MTGRHSAAGDGRGVPERPYEELTSELVREQATQGVVAVASRGIAISAIAFLGSLVLARLLTPQDFGIVAVGTALISFVALLSDGGLGGGLIRRAMPPTRTELSALTGLQLITTLLLSVVVGVVGLQFGETGAVVAVMVASMPLTAFQFPTRIMLERNVQYSAIARVEVLQVLTYNVTAIGLVLAGLGVWGMALGTVARGVVGAVAMLMVSPVKFAPPTFRFGEIRPLLSFGLRFQAVSATLLIRDQGLNAAIAAVAGAVTLGLASLARRLMEIPFLFLYSLTRVSLPAMSRLLEQGEDPAPLIRRALMYSSVGLGLVLVGLVGSAPGLIPGLFGQQWEEASAVLPGACLGLAISGTTVVAAQGFLYAVGDTRNVLRATAYAAATAFVVTLPLLGLIGTGAVGVGFLAAGLVEARILSTATRDRTGVKFLAPMWRPTVTGMLSGAIGWLTASQLGPTIPSGIAGGVLAGLLYLTGLSLLSRQALIDTVRFGFSAIRQSLKRT